MSKISSLPALDPESLAPGDPPAYALAEQGGNNYKVIQKPFSGDGLLVTQSGHGFKVGDAIRKTSTGTNWTKAQANSLSNAQAVGLVSYVSGSTFKVTFLGKVTIGSVSGGVYESALTIGSIYYLSDTTAGLCTTTQAPIIVLACFVAISPTVALILSETPRQIPSVQPAPGVMVDFSGNDDLILTGNFATDSAAILTLDGGDASNPFWRVCDGTNGTPDLRGVMTIGAGSGIGRVPRTLGQTGGSETHTLGITEIPIHDHPAPGGSNFLVNPEVSGGIQVEQEQEGPPDSNSTRFPKTGSAGGGQPHDNMSPFYVVYKIRRTSRLR